MSLQEATEKLDNAFAVTETRLDNIGKKVDAALFASRARSDQSLPAGQTPGNRNSSGFVGIKYVHASLLQYTTLQIY